MIKVLRKSCSTQSHRKTANEVALTRFRFFAEYPRNLKAFADYTCNPLKDTQTSREAVGVSSFYRRDSVSMKFSRNDTVPLNKRGDSELYPF